MYIYEYNIELSPKSISIVDEAYSWCIENFGSPNEGTWDTNWLLRKYTFKNSKDMMMFSLRWGHL
jgi:hypothetical protein